MCEGDWLQKPLLTVGTGMGAGLILDGRLFEGTDIYNTCALYLGKGLSLLIDVLNPERIVLGSIYGRAKPLLDPAMTEVIKGGSIGWIIQRL